MFYVAEIRLGLEQNIISQHNSVIKNDQFSPSSLTQISPHDIITLLKRVKKFKPTQKD